jgi:hypothetical protein
VSRTPFSLVTFRIVSFSRHLQPTLIAAVAMKMVAVKILSEKSTKESAAAFEKEMKMLMECDFQHKNVVTLLGVFRV